MTEVSSFWARRALSRRAALRSAMAAGGGLAALSLVGCGGDDDEGSEAPSSQTTQEILDPTKGVRGGKLVWQGYGEPGGGINPMANRNLGVHQLAGLTNEGLLEHRNGTPAFDGYDIGVQPSLAQAMPEEPADGATYIFKLRPAKFHNGRQITSEDVKYSFDRYSAANSPQRVDWTWFDRVETPDPQTVVVKLKEPWADAPQFLSGRSYSLVHAKEHVEGPDADKKLMGTGPYTFVEYSPPTITRYKRFAEYHRQPYPYFEEIDRLGDSDTEKKLADFVARQVHMTYWFNAEYSERIVKSRPDALKWAYVSGGGAAFFRTDKPPFNDKRIRQALNMAIDRKAWSQALTQGAGELDQVLSIAGKYWGFRKPSEFPPAIAKLWNYDIQAAKQLMSASGVTLPIKGDMMLWNAQVVGPGPVDAATLLSSMWRSAGFVDAKLVEQTFGQSTQSFLVGNYDPFYWGPNTTAYDPVVGKRLKDEWSSPPEGIKSAPTLNLNWVNNQTLTGLVGKQYGVKAKEERIQLFRQIEEIIAEEQYRLGVVSSLLTWFGDQGVKNMQSARDWYNGTTPGLKYWWFADGKAP